MHPSQTHQDPECIQLLRKDWPDDWQQIQDAGRALLAAQGDGQQLWQAQEEEQRFWRLLAVSPFARRQLLQHPHWLPLLLSGQPVREGDLCSEQEETFLQALRKHRQLRLLQILWADLQGPGALDQTLQDLTLLAEESLQLALEFGQRKLEQAHGIPRDEEGNPVPFVVIGMGKLGGAELNLSSDIDLIFVYGKAGESDGPLPMDNANYFQRLGQWLIRALDERRAEGFVFRVDMRLRPFGDAGPLCVTGDALEQYYHRHGRTWERYALLKARPVAGDLTFGREVLERLQPFLFRRYLDFTALQGLRRVKALMDANEGSASQDLKKGLGGIREIEFIAQSLQLIHGGRHPALRQRATLPVLQSLADLQILSPEDVHFLSSSYRFWRRIEHALQMVEDQQTQTLPKNDLCWLRLSCALLENPSILPEKIARLRQGVHGLFLATLGTNEEVPDDSASLAWLAARHNLEEEEPPYWSAIIAAPNHGESWSKLRRFAQSRRLRSQLSQRGQARLDALLPAILRNISTMPNADAMLERIIPLLEALLPHSQYLALLAENPAWRERLLQLCQSPWLTQALTRWPELLEEVLRQPSPSLWTAMAESSGQGENLPAEEKLEQLRRTKNGQVLEWASSFWAGDLPIAELLHSLSDLAAWTLQQCLPWAVQGMVLQHGHLPGGDFPFAVIAYGKLGAREMGLASDLDLVFLYDAPEELESDGRIPLSSSAWFARLGQRLIHFLHTHSRTGKLYDIDMRLRPSGQSGPLVSSLSAFARYQRESAWTWEHQALTRARFVLGDERLGAAFTQLRSEILSQKRDPSTLAQEIWAMRRRIQQEKFPNPKGFHLKFSPGALLDIEFLLQFAILRHNAADPALARHTGVLEQLAALATEGIWSTDAVDRLREHYLALRKMENQRFLELRGPLLDPEDPETAVWLAKSQEVSPMIHELGHRPHEE